MNSKTDPLLQPMTLKHLTLKNRVMSTSHEPAYSEDGLPAPDEEGILRVLPEWIQMDAVSYEMYCETDYTVQFEEVIKKRIPN